MAVQFYREGQAEASSAPDADPTKLRYILKNDRKRYRQLKKILAAEDIPDAKKVKKIRFVVNLLLPVSEKLAQLEKRIKTG